ncbi:MAG: hypothetical protein ACRDQ0_04675, partial [Pseudonocardia sp.]
WAPSAWAVLAVAGLALAALAAAAPSLVFLIAGAVIALAGAVGLVIEDVQARAEADAAHRAAGDFARAAILPDEPDATVAELVRAAARPDGDGRCIGLFDEHGRAEFAAAHNAPDCVTALRALRTQITDPIRYRDRFKSDSLTVTPRPDGRADVDACNLHWRTPGIDGLTDTRPPGPPPGPARIGRLTLAPINGGGGWTITNVRPC